MPNILSSGTGSKFKHRDPDEAAIQSLENDCYKLYHLQVSAGKDC